MADENDDKTLPDQQDDQTEGTEEELELPSDDEPTGDPTEDELEALTEEERAALAEDDEEDGEDGDDADDAGDDTPAAQAEPPAAQPAAQPETPPQVDRAALQPLLDKAKSDKAALFAQYEDGELTRDQYLAGLEEVDKTYAEAAAQAAVASKQEAEARDQWISAAKGYLAEVPELATQDHVDAFDAHVRAVTADPRSRGLTFRQMLEKAHRRYLADQPEVQAAIPALPGAKKPAQTQEAQPQRPRKPEPPITLARIPASVPSTVSDGRFGQLQQAIDNAATADEVEKIMASMTEAEREAFASMDV